MKLLLLPMILFTSMMSLNVLPAVASEMSQENVDHENLARVFIGHINEDQVADRVRVIQLDFDSNVVLFEIIDEADPDSSVSLLSAIEVGENFTDFPDIEFRKAGSITIHSGCSAVCGRYDTHVEYKAVYRGNVLILAGYTRTLTDRTEATFHICDVNLLNGRAEVSNIGEGTSMRKHNDRSFPISLIKADYVPEVYIQ